MTGAMTLLGPDPVPSWPPASEPTAPGVSVAQASGVLCLSGGRSAPVAGVVDGRRVEISAVLLDAANRLLELRLALTRARDALERHRDPLVAELDEVLAG